MLLLCIITVVLYIYVNIIYGLKQNYLVLCDCRSIQFARHHLLNFCDFSLKIVSGHDRSIYMVPLSAAALLKFQK